jgi:hypothetical protein
VHGGARGGGGWSRGRPAAAAIWEVPGGIRVGRWSGRQLWGVFGAAAEVEDGQR